MKKSSNRFVLVTLAMGAAAYVATACTDSSGTLFADGGADSAAEDATTDDASGGFDATGNDASGGDATGNDASGSDATGNDATASDASDGGAADATPGDGAIDAEDAEGGSAPPDASDAGDGGTCTFTLSNSSVDGGPPGLPCNANFNDFALGLGFHLSSLAGAAPVVGFNAYTSAGTPTATTYTSADTTCSGTVINTEPPNASPQWEEATGTAGHGCVYAGALNQGDFTLTITDPGTKVTQDGGTGSIWYGVHGTLTATVPPTPGDVRATGTFTLTATF